MKTNYPENIISSENRPALDIEDIISPFGLHIKLDKFEEIQKNNFDMPSIASPVLTNRQPLTQQPKQKHNGSILRFLKVLQKKVHFLKEHQKKISLFSKIYEEKIMQSELRVKPKYEKYIFNPKNQIYQAFQYFKSFSILIVLTIITYFWCFDQLDILKSSIAIYFFILMFGLDILSQFNLATFVYGQVIYDRKAIMKKYMSSQFIQDFIFLLSLILTLLSPSPIFVLTYYFSGIKSLFQVINKIEELFDISLQLKEILKLIKLLLLINLLAHLIACIWIQVGRAEFGDANWMEYKGIKNSSPQTQYIYSFYWSVVTMVTVGYGDITPQNSVEMIVCVIIIYLSCGVFAYSLNLIGQIVSAFNRKSQLLEKYIRGFNKYFKQHNIKEELQSRIKNFLQYKFRDDDENNQDFLAMFELLSISLKNSLMLDVFDRMVKNCPILNNNFSKDCLENIALFLEPKNFEQDDFIIHQEQQIEGALYFVDSGTLVVYDQISKTEIIELKEGQYIGEYEFFSGQSAKFSIKCKTQARVFQLQRKIFIEQLNKDDFETFHQIKDCFSFHIQVQGQRCIICNEIDHLIHNCQFLFYRPNFTKLIIRAEQLNQFRQRQNRRNRKYRIFEKLDEMQEKQFEFNQQYKQENLEDNSFLQGNTEVNSFLQNNFYSSEKNINKDKSYKKLISYTKTKSKFSIQENDDIFQKQQILENQNSRDQDQAQLKLFDFDRMKEYSNFFKSYNCSTVINTYNQMYYEANNICNYQKNRRAMRFIQL